jgi:hypothetical protein
MRRMRAVVPPAGASRAGLLAASRVFPEARLDPGRLGGVP